MPKQIVHLDSVGAIELHKKRGLRSLRLRVDHQGVVKVSVPWLVSQKFALNFVASKQDWILSQKAAVKPFQPYSAMSFGKSHILYITELAAADRTRLETNKLHIYLKGRLNFDNPQQMSFIQKAMLRALKADAIAAILPRAESLGLRHSAAYNTTKIKQLTGRWGSCDNKGNIIFSLFLVQLPWELIDYVIVHELAHINNMNHSASFWASVADMYPDYKKARRELKAYQPRIITVTTS